MTRKINNIDACNFWRICGFCRLGNSINFQCVTSQCNTELQIDISGDYQKIELLYLCAAFYAKSKIKGSYFSTSPNDKIWSKPINELDILVSALLVYISFIFLSVVDGVL